MRPDTDARAIKFSVFHSPDGVADIFADAFIVRGAIDIRLGRRHREQDNVACRRAVDPRFLTKSRSIYNHILQVLSECTDELIRFARREGTKLCTAEEWGDIAYGANRRQEAGDGGLGDFACLTYNRR